MGIVAEVVEVHRYLMACFYKLLTKTKQPGSNAADVGDATVVC